MSTPTSEDRFDSETPLFNVMKVSSRRSAFFYVDLAKKYFWTEEKLEISGLGQGIILFFFCPRWGERVIEQICRRLD